MMLSSSLRPDRTSVIAALAARRLDQTLTTSLPIRDPRDEYAVGSTGLSALDAGLEGGLPRGQLSELVGPASSGRTSVSLAALAAATARGELVALIDVLDRLDVESIVAAGVDLTRLLWIRGHVVANPGLCFDTNRRAMDQAVKALTLVLQAGNIGLVIFDAGDAPVDTLKRLPFTTWLRLQRMVEGSHTICLLIGHEPMARSSSGLTMALGDRVPGARFVGRLFGGLEIHARVIRARARAQEHATRPMVMTTQVMHG
jgi:recombination protein RecA